MTFHEAHVLLINTLARIFGGPALVAGSFFLDWWVFADLR
jgi:hypothetical protein